MASRWERLDDIARRLWETKMTLDELDRMRREIKDRRDSIMCEAKLEGMTTTDIAVLAGVKFDTARKVIEGIIPEPKPDDANFRQDESRVVKNVWEVEESDHLD